MEIIQLFADTNESNGDPGFKRKCENNTTFSCAVKFCQNNSVFVQVNIIIRFKVYLKVMGYNAIANAFIALSLRLQIGYGCLEILIQCFLEKKVKIEMICCHDHSCLSFSLKKNCLKYC